MRRKASRLDGDELAASALVFAPHPDDETLGCGGTIARKVQAGADVGVVFLKNGGLSHPRFMAQDELRAIRRREAVAACRALGVDEQRLAFLGFEDNELIDERKRAIEAVSRELERRRPQQVFVPFRDDGHDDHDATARIVRAAARRTGQRVLVFEYPVWRWRTWPWVSLAFPLRPRKCTAGVGEEWSYWVRTAEFAAGVRFAGGFNCRVDVRGVLETKRRALAEHRSQATRLNGQDEWWTLGDVCEGQWQRWFFSGDEWFRKSEVRLRR